MHGVDGGKVFVESAVELFGKYEAEWTVQADAKDPEDVGAEVKADGRADRWQQVIRLRKDWQLVSIRAWFTMFNGSKRRSPCNGFL